MYVRQVTAHFKPEKFDMLNKRFEEDVIPMLKKQSGFRDELSIFDKSKDEAITLSFWDTKQAADQYAREIYPAVHKKMEETLEDMPKIRAFEVANSTWYDIHSS